jgi:hypothetical protein
MVVQDFDVFRLVLRPDKADSVLLVDPNAVLAVAIPRESLKAVAGWDPKIIEAVGGIELVQLSPGNGPDSLWATATGVFGVPAVEDVLRAHALERVDHVNMIARMSCYAPLLLIQRERPSCAPLSARSALRTKNRSSTSSSKASRALCPLAMTRASSSFDPGRIYSEEEVIDRLQEPLSKRITGPFGGGAEDDLEEPPMA